MKVYAYMKCGKAKSASEDTLLINRQILKEGYFVSAEQCNCIAIADGVGGNKGGREASEYVLYRWRDKEIDGSRSSAIQLNNDLIQYSSSIYGMEQMATTLSAVIFDKEKPTRITHIGNSRVCAIQGEYLKQLTKDHTIVELLRSRGAFEAAERAPKNEITACFGAANSNYLNQLQVIDLEKEYQGFVLTTDGLHDYLDEDEIERFCSQGDYTEKAFAELAETACRNGSEDDKSIIVVILDKE